jgi:hypothetical protein
MNGGTVAAPATVYGMRRLFGDDGADGARFSRDRSYRYALWRVWDVVKPPFASIGLNPSTADERDLDPTTRWEQGWAVRHGFGAYFKLNLFALRSTDPQALYTAEEPVGPWNDATIIEIAHAVVAKGGMVAAAWGAHGRLHDREAKVLDLLRGVGLYCFSVNRDGTPRHSLYLPASTEAAVFAR